MKRGIVTMSNAESYERQIMALRDQIKDLENEIEFRDEAHCQELKLMQKHIQTLMNKYCLN